LPLFFNNCKKNYLLAAVENPVKIMCWCFLLLW
jgi:hypothetical protein